MDDDVACVHCGRTDATANKPTDTMQPDFECLQVVLAKHDGTLLLARMNSMSFMENPRELRQRKNASTHIDASKQSDYCLKRLMASDDKESSFLMRRSQRPSSAKTVGLLLLRFVASRKRIVRSKTV